MYRLKEPFGPYQLMFLSIIKVLFCFVEFRIIFYVVWNHLGVLTAQISWLVEQLTYNWKIAGLNLALFSEPDAIGGRMQLWSLTLHWYAVVLLINSL